MVCFLRYCKNQTPVSTNTGNSDDIPPVTKGIAMSYVSEHEQRSSPRTPAQQKSEPAAVIADNRTTKTLQRLAASTSAHAPSDGNTSESLITNDAHCATQGKFESIQFISKDEEPLQEKSDIVQRIEEEPLQGKELSILQKVADHRPKNTTGLPDNLRDGVESLSGLSMGGVNVHFNSDKPSQLHALAYTQGTDIHVAPGQEQHLAHEAWHVVQQMQGRVEPTTLVNGTVPVNDNAGLENEADTMGARASGS